MLLIVVAVRVGVARWGAFAGSRAAILAGLLGAGCFSESDGVEGSATAMADAGTVTEGSSGGATTSGSTSSGGTSLDGTSTAAGSTGAPIGCDSAGIESCVPAPQGWDGPQLLRTSLLGCPPGTEVGALLSAAKPVCRCDCNTEACVGQDIQVHALGCGNETVVPATLEPDVCYAAGGAVDIEFGDGKAETAISCTAVGEEKRVLCELPPCDGGACVGEVIADAQLCLTCANPPCGMCPAEFSTRLEFARTDENSACGCCGSMTGTRVCAGARDGCDPGAPPLPVGACAPTEGMIGYEPVTRCDEPMAPSGQALVACCAG